MCAAFKQGADVDLPRPFRRMTYAEAMSKYGSDKPDVRYGLEMAELADVVKGTEFKLFAGAIEVRRRHMHTERRHNIEEKDTT